MKTKIKKQVKKPKTNPVTQKTIKEAYNIVTADLFNRLVKAKEGETIRLNNIGMFEKRHREITSSWDGNTYTYYKFQFRMSSTLKKALGN